MQGFHDHICGLISAEIAEGKDLEDVNDLIKNGYDPPDKNSTKVIAVAKTRKKQITGDLVEGEIMIQCLIGKFLMFLLRNRAQLLHASQNNYLPAEWQQSKIIHCSGHAGGIGIVTVQDQLSGSGFDYL